MKSSGPGAVPRGAATRGPRAGTGQPSHRIVGLCRAPWQGPPIAEDPLKIIEILERTGA
jgi:hypothetical protein